MAIQGLVTVKSGNKVLMKVVAGSDGYNAQKVADVLKKMWQVTASKANQIADEIGFGCIECLVVMTEDDTVYHGDEELHPRYRKTFQKPDFNPRWARGTADHVVIIDV